MIFEVLIFLGAVILVALGFFILFFLWSIITKSSLKRRYKPENDFGRPRQAFRGISYTPEREREFRNDVKSPEPIVLERASPREPTKFESDLERFEQDLRGKAREPRTITRDELEKLKLELKNKKKNN